MGSVIGQLLAARGQASRADAGGGPGARIAQPPGRLLLGADGLEAPVVIWINGAFGAGKTKTARGLVAMRPRAWLFDPEQIGFMLRSLWPGAGGDFQDLPIWRAL